MNDQNRSPETDPDPSANHQPPLETRTGDPAENRYQRHEGHVPPQAIDVEQAVIGAMLVETDAVITAIDLLDPIEFYDHRHQLIFEAIEDLASSDEPIDLITVTEQLKERGELEGIGGGYYLSKLTGTVASAANTEYHCRIIHEKYLGRRTIEELRPIVGRMYEGEDPFDVLEDLESVAYELANARFRGGGIEHVSIGADQAMERLREWQEGQITDRYLTGIPSFDDHFGGLPRGEMTALGGLTGGFKTAFVVELVKRGALRQNTWEEKQPIVVFSAEMTHEQLVHRAASNLSSVPHARIRPDVRGRMEADQEEIDRYKEALELVRDLPVYVDQTSQPTPEEMRSGLLRIQQEHGQIAFSVLDYLEKTDVDRDTQEQRVAAAAESQKALAKELGTAQVALTQYSNGIYKRNDKTPRYTDYRYSGKIAQEAFLCLHIHPPFYWEDRGQDCADYRPDRSNQLFILCDKNRQGPIGKIPMSIQKTTGKFKDPEEEQNPMFGDAPF